MGSIPAKLTPLMATCWVAHRIAHAIDAEYGVAVGLVACADYGASLARLLRRLGEYNRQSEALYVRSHSLAARGPAIPGIVATIDDLIEH
jgi:hypothetical protein